jgi:dynein heavy chain
MKDDLLEEHELAPFTDGKFSFKSPQACSYEKYIEHINTGIQSDTPVAIGMHPNTEISFRTDLCTALFSSLIDILPRGGEAEGEKEGGDDEGGGGGGEGGNLVEDKLNMIMDKVGMGDDEKFPGRR